MFDFINEDLGDTIAALIVGVVGSILAAIMRLCMSASRWACRTRAEEQEEQEEKSEEVAEVVEAVKKEGLGKLVGVGFFLFRPIDEGEEETNDALRTISNKKPSV